MTPIKASELLRLAGSATPGPWCSDRDGDVWTPREVDPVSLFRVIGTTTTGPDNGDAAYIAAVNPDTIRALIVALNVASDALRAIECSCELIKRAWGPEKQCVRCEARAELRRYVDLEG